jgi:exodeoxyribonuclease VII large subunit
MPAVVNALSPHEAGVWWGSRDKSSRDREDRGMKRGTVERVGEKLRARVRGSGGPAARLRNVPDAVWDGGAAWFPLSAGPELMRALGVAEITWSPAALDAAQLDAPAFQGPREARDRDTFTPSSLNQAVGRLITEAFPAPVWVTGQLDGWSKGHRNYFDLIERKEGLAKARAKLSARIQNRHREVLEATAAEAGFALQDGLEVRLKGRVELYVPGGSYQFNVTEVDVAFTLAKFTQTRETVLATLRGQGLAQRNLALPLPPVPLRIGLISARGSDALEDVLSTLRASGYAFEVVFHHSTMQGQRLQEDIVTALRWFYSNAHRVDVLCIARGGGSRSDLAQFDTVGIGRGVCHQKIPVLVGIGHETDKCVLDDIARSMRTPTAVATALVAQVRDFLEGLAGHGRRIAGATRTRAMTANTAANAAGGRLARAVRRQVREEGRRVERVGRGLHRATYMDLGRRRSTLTASATRLQAGVRGQRRAAALRLDGFSPRLRRACAALARGEHRKTEALEARRAAADPDRILRRGYAIVRGDDGLVQAPTDAPQGTALRIRLAAGTLRATSHGANDDEP